MPQAALRLGPSPSASPRRLFSREEADRALPYLSRVVADVVRVYARVVVLRREIERCDDAHAAAQLERDYEGVMDRMAELVDEVHAVGGELKDFERGQVDFPARVAGRDVLLSWQRGEPTVTHWREPVSGPGRRHKLSDLLAA